VISACGTQANPTNPAQSTASGDYPVEIVEASFPARQHIDKEVAMRLTVRNTGTRTMPDVAATVTTGAAGTSAPAFARRDPQPGLAEPWRQVWLLDVPPVGGDNALANTWTLGQLAPGESKTFTWRVHPLIAGPHVISWSVAPAMRAQLATLASGQPAKGRLTAVIVAKAPSATVGSNDRVTKHYSN
jgi:hypothetical protein